MSKKKTIENEIQGMEYVVWVHICMSFRIKTHSRWQRSNSWRANGCNLENWKKMMSPQIKQDFNSEGQISMWYVEMTKHQKKKKNILNSFEQNKITSKGMTIRPKPILNR